MSNSIIIAAEKTIDSQGALERCQQLELRLQELSITPRILTIDPLRTGWHSPQQADHYRSGCAPLEALQHARQLISDQRAEAVIIKGQDMLKSGYSREERLRLMAIYGEDLPITSAYDRLAGHFIRQHAISETLFSTCVESLFENYLQTFSNIAGNAQHLLPERKWFNRITPRFRGVDCANPLVDFSGALILVNEHLADKLDIPPHQQVMVAGVDVQSLKGDGEAYLDEIAGYQHLKTAFERSCRQADLDYVSLFHQGRALLEVYSCYPVVPMAFMLVNGLIERLKDLPELLRSYAVTVTGGMNLARAPWNNPALNSLISMYQHLQDHSAPAVAAVHGNGGLGYKQGVAILKRVG